MGQERRERAVILEVTSPESKKGEKATSTSGSGSKPRAPRPASKGPGTNTNVSGRHAHPSTQKHA